MTKDFIFCPFCGEVEWTVDKSRAGEGDAFSCSKCKKFTYINIMQHKKTESGFEYFEKVRSSIRADLEIYAIEIDYLDKKTIIKDSWLTTILTLHKIIDFNWYNQDEVIEKVKKYLVFS